MKRMTNCFILIAFWLVVVPASVARAQYEVGDYTLSGEGEFGGLLRHRNGNRAKLEEYRQLPESVVVPHLELFIDSKKKDFYLEFESAQTGRDDQGYRLRFGRYGLIDMEFEWDQIPHLFNVDNARTPYTMRSGTYTLSSKPPNTTAVNSCANGTFCDWINGAAVPVDLKLFNGVGRFKVRYTPTPNWTFAGTYWSNNNSGKRAFGTIFGPSPGSYNITELAEPIDYNSHNIELGTEYAGNGWSIGFKYNASLFHNNTSTLIWDNPLNRSGLGSACSDSARYNPASSNGVDANRGPCRGQLDLYPSNQAHTFTLVGSASLPAKTHFMGTISYGWRLQNDDFLPMTINSAITQPTLPRHNLEGDVRPMMINATLVNRAIDKLNLKAFYRLYDLDNRSKSLVFSQGIVINDQAGTTTAPTCNPICPEAGHQTIPYQFSRNTIGYDAGYDFTRWLTAKFGYVYDRIHRTGLDVRHASENTIGPTVDIKPSTWSLLRASYRHSWRDAPDYNLEDKRFFEGARDRDRVSLFSEITPWEKVSFHAAFEYTGDSYPNTTFGTQNDSNYSPSIGFIYSPAEWIKFFGDYNWDRFAWRLDARTGSPPVPWNSLGREKINTVTVGSDVDIIPNLLGLRLQYGFSDAVSKVFASGDGATNYPTIINRWHEVLTRLEYKFHKNVGLNLAYYYNGYTSKDYGVDIMKVWMGDVDTGANVQRSFFLGDRLKGTYVAHFGYLGLKVRF
jgi:MtrB/PioB family decaheme-associated outer membrane protein